MTTYLGKSCSFGLPWVPFVNCRQFMYLVISLLVLRAGWMWDLIVSVPDLCLSFCSFTSCGRQYKFLLRNPRVLLVQTLLTFVFHLKSLVIVTPRYLMLSMFSRSVPSKVYKAWIFLIHFLVSCFILHLTGWNLIPHFLAQEPNRYISLWSFIVSSSSLISRLQTQSSAKSLISDSISDEMSLCTERTTRDQERCPGGHPKEPEPSQILLHLQQLVVVWSKESIHFNVLPPIP